MKTDRSISSRSIHAMTGALLCASGLSVFAAAEHWDIRFGVPNLNNQLFALDVSASGTVAIGGSFSGNSLGDPGALNANKVALWNGVSWSALGTGPDHGPGGTVHAVSWVGDNLYVGGSFAGANGVTANNLVRWTGGTWSTLTHFGTIGVNGAVYALQPKDGQLYAAGDFTLAGSVFANRVALWDGINWYALGSGVYGGANPVVTALAVAADGSVYAGGAFTTAGGIPAANIAKWNGATWSPMGTGLTGPGAVVRAIVIAPNGDVVAGGKFTTAGDQPAQNLARWNGSAWQEVVGGVQEGEVLALAYDGDDLWVGGTFTKANTYNVPYLGVLQNGIWNVPGIYGVNSEVRQIVVRPSGVYLIGSFQTAGDRKGLLGMVMWDRTRFHALHRGFIGGAGYAHTISAAGTNVIAVGEFDSVGGQPARGVARWDGEDWQLLGTPQNSGINPPQQAITALALPNGEAYVGGAFSSVAGVGAWNIARWTGSGWQSLGNGLQDGSNTRVNAIVQLPDGSIVAGGTFLTAGSQPAKNIARWDGQDWTPLADGLHWSFDTSRGDVQALAWAGDRLYAAGGFDRSGALAVNAIAWWDGATWHALDGGVTYQGTYGSIQALALQGFEVFVGGAITQAGSVPAAWIAKWRPGSGWSTLGAGLDSGTDDLLVHGGKLYVAGNFTQSGGAARPGLAAWENNAWQTVNGGLAGDNPGAVGLAAAGTNVFVSGGFEGVGTVVSTRFAKLNLSNAPPSVAWVTPVPDALLPNGIGIVLEVSPTDVDGTVARVEFFVESSATPLATVNAAPWKYTWNGGTTGTHRLAARVTDNSGATTWTLVRRVEVLPPGGNAPPQVAITSPANGSTFKATINRLLIAEATDADGNVVKVDFYASNVPLGTANASPWQVIWPDLQAGAYSLRAVAWDNSGAKATSVVANVTVLPPNSAPYLEINDIYEGTVIEDPGTLTLRANSSDGDGGLTSVEFFVNGLRVADFTTQLDRWSYDYLWDPVPPGAYTFRVLATDTDGATSERVVHFTVTPFNQPPQLALTGIADGAAIGMPNSIPLTVQASDPDGQVARVLWLNSGSVLGVKTNPPWVFSLRNLAAVPYFLQARAIDNQGKSTTTPGINFTVTNNPAAQPRYRLVELVIPGGNDGQAFDVNNANQVAAAIKNGNGDTRGYLYANGSFLDIGDTLTPRHVYPLYCAGINDGGIITGWGHIRSMEMAYVWSGNTLTELGVLGEPNTSGMFSRGRAINGLGHVVGGSRNSNGVARAFLHSNGAMKDLGGLGPALNESEAFDLNDQDQVVGWTMGSAGRQAFLYDPVNGMRGLGYFGGNNNSEALGINKNGQIVGSFLDAGNQPRAFLWSAGIEIQLGTLGGQGSIAHDINDLGQIVGTSDAPYDRFGGTRAFLWQGCAMFDLNRSVTNLNWELRSANAINNAGWIVGIGNRDFESQFRAFLLIPDTPTERAEPYSPISFVGGRFQMCVPAPPNTTYRLDASTDLTTWMPVSTNFVPEGVLDFHDPDTEAYPNRFYRAVLLP